MYINYSRCVNCNDDSISLICTSIRYRDNQVKLCTGQVQTECVQLVDGTALGAVLATNDGLNGELIIINKPL